MIDNSKNGDETVPWVVSVVFHWMSSKMVYIRYLRVWKCNNYVNGVFINEAYIISL